MHTLLIGGTGTIGSAILTELLSRGHRVTALVRSARSAERVRAAGATPLLADMTDRAAVLAAASDVDGAINAAIADGEDAAEAERVVTEALLEGLSGRDAVLVRTGGLWVHGAGEVDEDTPRDAPQLVAWREAIDRRALAASGLRSVLIEPGVVYGHGAGIPNVLVNGDIVDGALSLIGGGEQRWGTVHADDLAELYVLALERAEHDSVLIAANGDAPSVRELGEAASRALGLDGRVRPVPEDRVLAELGGFGEALLLDQRATGERARTVLGWRPSRPSLVDELVTGGYPRENPER